MKRQSHATRESLESLMKRALDLYCCAGGATRGLQLASYHVTGVDINPQPRYCGDQFIQADCMAVDWGGYDLIWASPPCQRYSRLTPKTHKESHPDLLPVVLKRLRNQETPYIVENVAGTQHMMRNPIFLCGTMFGLNIWRHRWFEIGNSNAFFLLPLCNHLGHPVLISGVSRWFAASGKRYEYRHAEKTSAIGIDWMTTAEIDEAIPPIYSKFLAEQIDRWRLDNSVE